MFIVINFYNFKANYYYFTKLFELDIENKYNLKILNHGLTYKTVFKLLTK